MHGAHSLIVYRGEAVPLGAALALSAELFGGHLRPDATLVAFGSAPVRVHRGAPRDNPLAGTVRGLHLGVSPPGEDHLTAISPMVLQPRMGFGEHAEDAWPIFGRFPSEALALSLSERFGAFAVLTTSDDDELLGAYSLFSGGRRVWSAAFLPGLLYATFDGNDLRTEPMDAGDPAPPEGGHTEFAVHGLSLLFGETLPLSYREREALLPTLIHACRPPTTDAEAMVLARDGRFLAEDIEPTAEELEAVASFVEPAPGTSF